MSLKNFSWILCLILNQGKTILFSIIYLENTKPSILKKEASFTEIQDGGSAQDDKNAASLRRSNRSAAKLANESMILQNITQKSSKRR